MADNNNIKRLNLYFNLDNKKSKDAYKLICDSMFKTAFIIDAVLAFKKDENIDKEIIKEAVKEVLLEFDYNLENQQDNSNNQQSDDIPDEIFNLINDL